MKTIAKESAWLVEQRLPGGRWVPCLEAFVNSLQAMAIVEQKKLSQKYAVKYRVKKYVRAE